MRAEAGWDGMEIMASLSCAWVPWRGEGSILERIERNKVMCDLRVVKSWGWEAKIDTA
jgi:hypothetical protein